LATPQRRRGSYSEGCRGSRAIVQKIGWILLNFFCPQRRTGSAFARASNRISEVMSSGISERGIMFGPSEGALSGSG